MDNPSSLPFTSDDGEVTVSAPSTWETWLPGKGVEGGQGSLGRVVREPLAHGQLLRDGERIEIVDPVAYDSWCADHDGSPLLSAPADAASIATGRRRSELRDDRARAGTGRWPRRRVDGRRACHWRRDVRSVPDRDQPLDPLALLGAGVAHPLVPRRPPRRHVVETLAITVVAPDERFDAVIAETAPIIESFEVPAPGCRDPQPRQRVAQRVNVG